MLYVCPQRPTAWRLLSLPNIDEAPSIYPLLSHLGKVCERLAGSAQMVGAEVKQPLVWLVVQLLDLALHRLGMSGWAQQPGFQIPHHGDRVLFQHAAQEQASSDVLHTDRPTFLSKAGLTLGYINSGRNSAVSTVTMQQRRKSTV